MALKMTQLSLNLEPKKPDPKFYNKDGTLNKRGLRLGYAEKKKNFILYCQGEWYHIVGVNADGKVHADKHWLLKEARKILRRFAGGWTRLPAPTS